MKSKYLILTVIILVGGSAVSGYNINRDKKEANTVKIIQQAKQNIEDVQDEFGNELKKFKFDTAYKMRANERKLEDFRRNIQLVNRTLKTKYKKEIEKLEQKIAYLREKLGNYKYDGLNGWEEFKNGFNYDLDAVTNSIKDLPSLPMLMIQKEENSK